MLKKEQRQHGTQQSQLLYNKQLVKPEGSVVAERLTNRALDVEVWVPALHLRVALLIVGRPDGSLGLHANFF